MITQYVAWLYTSLFHQGNGIPVVVNTYKSRSFSRRDKSYTIRYSTVYLTCTQKRAVIDYTKSNREHLNEKTN